MNYHLRRLQAYASSKLVSQFTLINSLHIFNDGYEASFFLLLPFISKDLGLTLTEVGILGTIINISRFFLAYPSSYIGARFGGIKTLIFAMLIYSVSYIVAGASSLFLVICFACMIAGAGYGLFHPISFSLIAKWSEANVRGKAMANFTAIGDLGKIAISTFLTFIAVYIGWRSTTALFAIIGFIAFFLLLLLFHTKTDKITKTDVAASVDVSYRNLLRSKKFIYATLINVFDCFASTSLFVFLPFLLLKRHVDPTLLGSFTAAFFIGNFAGKYVLGRFADKYKNTTVFIASEICMSLAILFLANTENLFLIVACSILLGIFTKGTVPVVQTIVAEAAEHHGNFEKVFSINSMSATFAIAAAPVILGFLSDKFSIVSAFNFMAFAGLLAIVPAILFQRDKNK